jgi:hypothetical protein
VSGADRAAGLWGVAAAHPGRRAARAIAERCYDLSLTARRTVDAIDQLIERWARPDR